jgi:hypothetical protein
MQPSSKVIVMDEDGSQSKAVARALHRFGIKVCPPSTCDSCILKCVIYKICSHSTELLDGSWRGWNSIWCNLQKTSDTTHTSFADVHLCLKQTVCLVGNSEFGWIWLQRRYRMDGGFRAWNASGLRTKPEGTETAITILKEVRHSLICFVSISFNHLGHSHWCTMRNGWWVDNKHFSIGLQFPS